MKSAWKKLLSLLDRRERTRLRRLFVLMVGGAFFEVLSVSMIVPLAAVMLGGSHADNPALSFVRRILPGVPESSVLLGGLAALIALFLIKTTYLLLEYRLQFRFVYENRFRLQQRLLHAFLRQPYEYYLQAKTGEILRVIQVDVIRTFDLLSALLVFSTELIVSVFLIFAVFLIDPVITAVMAGVMLLLVLLITGRLKPRQKKRGKERNRLHAQMNKWLLQSVRGIREVRIGRKEDYFEKQYLSYGKDIVRIDEKQAVLNGVPKLLIESVSVCSVLVVMSVLVLGGTSPAMLVPKLAAFAMAAVKLIPCMNRIAQTINQTAFSDASLDSVLAALKSGESPVRSDAKHAPALHFEHEIRLSGITFRYPDTETNVLLNADLRISKGECVGIIGASGAGKTTAVDILAGLLAPQEGRVLLDGTDVRTDNAGWLSHLGYIPQTVFLTDDTIRANVAFGVPEEKIDERALRAALEEAQLSALIDSLPEGDRTQTGEHGIRLSGGQRQRIGIARVLYGNPDVLIFDEATSSLDPETEGALLESIFRLRGKKTMIIVSHRESTVSRCDKLYRIADGRILPVPAPYRGERSITVSS